MNAKRQNRSMVMYLLFGFTGILIAAYSFIIYRYVDMQINDEVRINIAGRLRMLTQKITKDALLYRTGNAQKKSIENSIVFFEQSVRSLVYGGPVTEDIHQTMTVYLTAMDDLAGKKLLAETISQWQRFKHHASRYLDYGDGESLKYIIVQNEELLSTIDLAVLAIQKHATRDQRVLGLIVASFIILVIIALLAAFIRQVSKFRKAAALLEEIEHLLPICSSCKKIRTDNERPEDPASWISIEGYLQDKKDMFFTHSLCPDCVKRLYPGLFGDKK